jgi:hypothetical protein
MRRAWHAAAAYLALAIVATWPLTHGLGRDVPADLGDPVFVMWALAWDCQQLLAILRGDLARLATFFDANIFYPLPLTLAYSEHFIAQAVQILPVWALTGNPILCYNLLYLSTFVLSGLGAYLFVREITGNPRAALVAGMLFAFAPYRFPQSSHLQVLSSQWMPFALYGFRRFFDSLDAQPTSGGGWRPLLGAAAALVAQNLSCAYYLMFFAPFVIAYVVWEIWSRRLWTRTRLWIRLGTAAVVVAVLTVPLLLPYAMVQEDLQIARSRGELSMYAADVYSYATAVSEQILWGSIARVFPKAEGDLFPGLTAVFLALIGVATWRRDASLRASSVSTTAWVCLGVAAIHLFIAGATLLYRRFVLDLGLFTIRVTNIDQLLFRAVVLVALAALVSPVCRSQIAAFMRTRGFYLLALVAALWLSLGIAPQTLGRPLNLTGLYQLLYTYVPGFDGLRVPARFNMIAVLMLAVLGGYGAAALTRWRWATPALVILTTAFFAESLVRPFPINGLGTLRDYATPEARLYRPARAPAVYRRLAQESGVVLAELPLGQPDYDIRAMFYSVVHHARLLNGYSGFFPPHYGLLALSLSDVPAHATTAWDTLRSGGVSHVIVHEAAWLDDRGPRTTAALTQLGATEVFRDGSDVILRLPGHTVH